MTNKEFKYYSYRAYIAFINMLSDRSMENVEKFSRDCQELNDAGYCIPDMETIYMVMSVKYRKKQNDICCASIQTFRAGLKSVFSVASENVHTVQHKECKVEEKPTTRKSRKDNSIVVPMDKKDLWEKFLRMQEAEHANTIEGQHELINKHSNEHAA